MFITEEYMHHMGGTVADPYFTIHLGEYGILEDLNLTELINLRHLINETHDHWRTQHFLWEHHREERKKI